MSTPTSDTNDGSTSPGETDQPVNGMAEPTPREVPAPAGTSDVGTQTWMVAVTVGVIVGFLAFVGALAGGIVASYAPSYNTPDPAPTQEEPAPAPAPDPSDTGVPVPPLPEPPGYPAPPVNPMPPIDPMPPVYPEPPVNPAPIPEDPYNGWGEEYWGGGPGAMPGDGDMWQGDVADPTVYVAAAREITAAQEDANIVTMALDELGFDYRVVAIDGEFLPVTQDYSATRLNLEIQDGIVVAASVG